MSSIDLDDEDESGQDSVDVPAPNPAPATVPNKPLDPQVQAYLQTKAAQDSQFQKNQEAMAEARNKSAKGELIAGLSRSFGQLANSTYGNQQAFDEKPYDAIEKEAGEPIEQEKERQANQANDPDSEQSVSYRNTLKATFPKIAAQYGDSFDNITAADAPNITKIYDTKIVADQRAEAAKEHADAMRQNSIDRNAMLGKSIEGKNEKYDQKLATEMSAKLDSSGARAGNFGKAGAMVMASDRILGLLKQFPDGNVPKAQTEELATAVAAMVGGGSVQSQNQINSVVPQSMAGNANAIVGCLTNEPRGMGQQAFIKNLQDSANRERSVAQSQMEGIKAQRLAPYMDFYNRSPNTFNRILKSSGMDPKNYDGETGLYTPSESKNEPAQGKPPGHLPGSVVTIKGSDYRVGADGDTLEPL